MNWKDEVDFATLFTLRESRRTSDSALSRDCGRPLQLHPLRSTLKPSDFCNVRVKLVIINQFIASATAEKMTALLTEEYLSGGATKASRKKFQAVLDKVPDVVPENYNKL
ncbi:MAG: hypothetical protein PVG70_20850 [Desulfobacterales bacterium]